SKKAANPVMKSVTHFIEKKLGLIVNAEKSRISRPGNIKFLGFGFYYVAHTKKYRPRVHQESVHKFQRKLKQLTKRNQGISLNNRIKKSKQVIYASVKHFRLVKMNSILTTIDAQLHPRIRVIIWKQGKSNKRRIKSLIQLGITKEEAKGLTYCRKGYRFIVLSKVVHRALSNKRLKQRGIPFALDYYLEV